MREAEGQRTKWQKNQKKNHLSSVTFHAHHSSNIRFTFLWEMIFDEEEHGTLWWQFDALSNHKPDKKQQILKEDIVIKS
jgi:hypothetical protein